MEEAILDVLCMAEGMEGVEAIKVEALPMEKVKELMQKYL
jgi:D-aminopeptidase